MADGVQFDEPTAFESIPEPAREPPTFAQSILHAGIVSSPGDGAIVLSILAGLLVVASFYLLASSVPPVPELGADVPRAGEVIPEYVSP